MEFKKSCQCCYTDRESELEEYEHTHFAEAMVLSCIDYRFIDSVISFLETDPVLAYKYDLSTLAGASLGYNQDKFKCWAETFTQMTKIAIDLHSVKKIVIFDHMDCGAYAMFYPHITLGSEEERQLHIKNIKQCIEKLSLKFPELTYSAYLVHVDGLIETIVSECKIVRN